MTPDDPSVGSDGRAIPQLNLGGEPRSGDGSQTHVADSFAHAKKIKGRNTRATLNIGTLNINGRGNLTNDANNKWNALNQLVRSERIGILAVQETHLNKDFTDKIHSLYGRRLIVINGKQDTDTAGGVAIILNRELVDTAKNDCTTIIPGRAMTVTIHWHQDKKLTLLNVYAPNNQADNSAFWDKILDFYSRPNHKLPDVVLGDFNAVEEAMDRLPPKDEHAPTLESLQRLLDRLKMRDGWRQTNPQQRDYSFPQRASPTRSRLDRIYTSDNLLRTSQSWEIKTTGVPTDHRLATAALCAAQSPYIGKGRWSIPVTILQDKMFMNFVCEIGLKAQKEIETMMKNNSRTNDDNPQRIYKQFKISVVKHARDIIKKRAPKLETMIKRLTLAATEIQAEPAYETNTELQTESEAILDRIVDLERKRYQHIKEATSARYSLNAETLSKYWSAINKDKSPRDIIYSLRKPDSQAYVRRSDEMAELAKQYHDALQDLDTDTKEDNARESATTASLGNIQSRLDWADKALLTSSINKDDIKDALRRAQPGKACGLDGIPYELWKGLPSSDDNDDDNDSFDSLSLLKHVFNDIETFGTDSASGFAEGWMCPIYKKKDKRDISNYRPITVLNSDYKLYTRVLATKLGTLATKLIHPNQAGFIPGRHITDQTQICRTMVDYAEATEENGVIIALDQEKAYDRIKHKYLWAVLHAMGFPATFIRRIQDLYEHATTLVMINGELSQPFRVRRGVRQGDPLSCLLFDLAIEPLACALRNSALKGFQIPGVTERLITSLFADDTSAFLTQHDKWADLWTILEYWCLASGARFNTGKTEVIPVGSEEYRRQVVQTRRINPLSLNDQTIPDYIRIAKDGEAVRILGAWIGNKTYEAAIWAPTIQKVENFLTRWGRCNPSLKGKRHIIQMGPGGITQYLTTVQGMPAHVEKQLTKQIRTFVWGRDRTPLVNLETLHRPVDEGGLDILDIKIRNDAIELTWLKKYLDLSSNRPTWAFMTDALIALHVSKSAGAIQSAAQINTFLQSWNPAAHAASLLPSYIKRLIKTAKTYNASFGAIKLDKALKSKLPIWYHISASKRLRRLDNTAVSKCLRTNHGIKYVADLMIITRHGFISQTDEDSINCRCEACSTATHRGCHHTLKCIEAAHKIIHCLDDKWNPRNDSPRDGLTLTTRRKDSNIEAIEKEGDVIFDPSVTERGGVAEAFRVFVDEDSISRPPAVRARRGLQIITETLTIYILNAPRQPTIPLDVLPVGSGVMVLHNRNPTIRLVKPIGNPDDTTTSGEIAAALYAAQSTPKDVPIHFVCETLFLRNVLCKDLTKWENTDWLGMSNKIALKALTNILRQRCAVTSFRKAGSSDERKPINEGKRLVPSLANEHRAHEVTPITDLNLNISGARLSSISQRLAYRIIRDRRDTPERRSTVRSVQSALQTAKTHTNDPILPRDLWKSLRHHDIRRPIADFLWKSLHNAFRCGDFWAKIPGYEDRATCNFCGVNETLAHILTECHAPGQKAIWQMAGRLWSMKQAEWTTPTINDILGSGMREWRSNTGQRRPLVERMWRILITESAYLVWCLRCERVIEHAENPDWIHAGQTIQARWGSTINKRLHLEIATTHRRFGRSALKKDLVIGTWHGTLRDEHALPDDWTTIQRVLVGINPRCYVLDIRE